MSTKGLNPFLKRTTCYISSHPETNIHEIVSVLTHQDVRILDTSSAITSTKSIHDSITSAISKADFVVAILNESNDNIYYEIGYASALKKEIFVIAPKSSRLPVYIESILVLRIDIGNIKAFEFTLKQLLLRIGILNSKKLSSVSNSFIGFKEKPLSRSSPSTGIGERRLPKYHSLGQKVDKYLEQLTKWGDNVRERDLEKLVCDALEESGVSILVRSPDKDKSADIAVWIDKFKSFQNPILIEIKTRIRDNNQADAFSRQISEYLESNQSSFALVLYSEGIAIRHYMHPWMESFIYFMPVRHFIELLEKRSFKKILLDIVKERYSESE